MNWIYTGVRSKKALSWWMIIWTKPIFMRYLPCGWYMDMGQGNYAKRFERFSQIGSVGNHGKV